MVHCWVAGRTGFTGIAPSESLCGVIGPEGDLTPGEVQSAQQAGFTPIHLWQSRRRTETAALSAVWMFYAAYL